MLLLVDGSSYLYRAFHAMPDLRSRSGAPTGAIHGVLAMLRRLAAAYRDADKRAIVFDARGPTFRTQWYPDYKANRPPMAEDLAAQIEPLHAAIAALGWPLLSVAGVEADDVIGALAARASARGESCVIATGDKDMAQLVDAQTTLINTMNEEKLDAAGVEAKFGVPPQRIVDYLALVGDAVDNVPGVPRVGPKTAVKWLQKYGDLDGVIAHADEISGAAGASLKKHLDFLPLGKRLVTIVRDIELPHVDLTPRPVDAPTLRRLYEEMDFRSWLDELRDGGAPPATQQELDGARPGRDETPRADYACILDTATLSQWLQRMQGADRVAIDCESTSLDPMQARLVGLSFAFIEEGVARAAYLPLSHDYPGAPQQIPLSEALQMLKPWLQSPLHKKTGQNLKYDSHVLANHDIALAGVADDSLLASYLLAPDQRHDLDSLAKRHLGRTTITWEEVAGKGAGRISFNQVEMSRAVAYAAEDADVALELQRVLTPLLAAEAKLERLYREVELPLAQVLLDMERHGVLLDGEVLARQSDSLGRRLLELESEAHQLAGQPFNLNSPKQLAEILFVRQGLPVVKKTPSGAPSTDEEVLAKLAEDFPLPKRLLEHRSLAKLKSAYTDKLPRMINPDSGRIHTNFSQAVAVTGRLASSDPNLQNIPVRTAEGRRIRAAFIAPAGSRLVSADYSQIELRIMAHLSQDAGLLRAFAAGEDVHRATAAEVFGAPPEAVSDAQRRAAKAINFGLIYGMSAFGLAKQIDVERSVAQSYIERYFTRYPGVARYMEETRAAARQQGFVETVLGRRLHLAEIRSANPARRQAAERAAINAPMQGTAADIIKLAMIAVQQWLQRENLAARLILQVHDELVLETPAAELDLVKTQLPLLMAGVAQLSVPLLAQVGDGANWDEAH